MRDPFDEIQRAFAAALDDPDRAAALLPYLREEPAQGRGQTLLRERIALYRGNVRAARRAALANAYPVLHALGGDAWFDALALAYARAHPARDGDLNRFGAVLPEFVEQYETGAPYRYFGDVARIERALHRAAQAADCVPLPAHAWQALGAERLARTRVAVHPACVALASRYASADVWRAHQPGGPMWPPQIDGPSWCLIVRPQWRPGLVVQTAGAHAAFVALQRGATVDAALDAAFAAEPAFDVARQWRTWIDAAAIVGVLPDGVAEPPPAT